MRHSVTTGFDADLEALLPRLLAYALLLTHNRDQADDLVQETVAKALAARRSFRPGTNFPAWLHRIEHNVFVSGQRRTRFTVPLDDSITDGLASPPQQESGLVVREFVGAFRRLSDDARKTLLLAVVEGQCHKQIASHCGVSVGTVKSRTFRARLALEQMLGDAAGGAGRDRNEATPIQRPVAHPPCARRRTPGAAAWEIERVRGDIDVSHDLPCARARVGARRDDCTSPAASAARVGGHPGSRGRRGLPFNSSVPQSNLA